MAIEHTLSILKPDITRRNLTGAVNAKIEAAGFRIIAQKRVLLSQAQAEQFYFVHRERPFFGELIASITSGPIVVQVLSKEGAVAAYRDLMGATNPKEAAAHSLRHEFALSIGENSVHGSDSQETAQGEIAQFFSKNEIFP